MAAGGVVVYVLIDLALFLLRPDLSLLHRAESDYGVGPYSWLMDLNFLLRGALSLALAGALFRIAETSVAIRVGAVLLAAWGVGSAILAFFPDDPPGTPITASGGIHVLVAFLAFFAVAVGTIVLSFGARSLPHLRGAFPWLLGLSILGVVFLLLLGRTHLSPHSPDGLYERLFLLMELVWMLAAGLQLARAAELREARH